VSRGELMQQKPAIRCFDEKLRGFDSDSRLFRLGVHIEAPQASPGQIALRWFADKTAIVMSDPFTACLLNCANAQLCSLELDSQMDVASYSLYTQTRNRACAAVFSSKSDVLTSSSTRLRTKG
jgi:hypothetical protein